MPIANCIIHPDLDKFHIKNNDLIEIWSTESKVKSLHMTINVVISQQQFGKQYPVMASLIVPSIWPTKDISALQLGLTKSLAKYYQLSLRDVFVSTSVIESGKVVENGEEAFW